VLITSTIQAPKPFTNMLDENLKLYPHQAMEAKLRSLIEDFEELRGGHARS
jgi:hypothetical protein